MLFLQNKYTSWYYSIISKAQDRTIEDYTEKHHIVPRTLGGSNNKNNIVVLTAREHFVCHLLLTKMLTGSERQKMVYALHMLSNAKNSNQLSRYIPSSKLYEYERKIFSEIHSVRMKENHPFHNPLHRIAHQRGVDRRGPTSVKGAKRSESMKEKMRNRSWTDKAIENRLNNCLKAAKAKKGSTWSDEKREQMFMSYIAKNKHLFPQVFSLSDSGINTRQISIKLQISWDRVKYILDNRDRINNI
jgi:hypothetical protein